MPKSLKLIMLKVPSGHMRNVFTPELNCGHMGLMGVTWAFRGNPWALLGVLWALWGSSGPCGRGCCGPCGESCEPCGVSRGLRGSSYRSLRGSHGPGGGWGPCGWPLGLVEGPVGCHLVYEGVCIGQVVTHMGLMRDNRVY